MGNFIPSFAPPARRLKTSEVPSPGGAPFITQERRISVNDRSPLDFPTATKKVGSLCRVEWVDSAQLKHWLL